VSDGLIVVRSLTVHDGAVVQRDNGLVDTGNSPHGLFVLFPLPCDLLFDLGKQFDLFSTLRISTFQTASFVDLFL